MKRRMLALLLAGVMAFSVTACGGGGVSSKDQRKEDSKSDKQVGIEISSEEQGPPPEDAPVGGQFVVGITPGSLSPDMRSGWAANASNSGFLALMEGYYTVIEKRDRTLNWDPVVVKEHEVTANDDGSKTYRIVINDNLKWSDGTPITAKDYVFGILMGSSPEYAACEADATAG